MSTHVSSDGQVSISMTEYKYDQLMVSQDHLVVCTDSFKNIIIYVRVNVVVFACKFALKTAIKTHRNVPTCIAPE